MDELGDLGGFPIELVLEALNNLAIRDLLRCRRVCKTLKTLIDESIAMQYRVRLALCGYVDGPQSLDGSFSTTASRLEALEAHINRWRHLDWVESRITLPQRPEHNSRRPEHLLAGGMFFDCDSDVLTCIELPSIVRGSPGRIWSHTDFNFRVHSFVADPGQDLLVLVEMLDWDPSLPKKPCEMLVHLRTVSGNTPHPRALTPILSRDGSILPHLLGRLAIMGETLAFIYRDACASETYTSIMIWNWCTGEVILDAPVPRGASSFLWVGHRTMLMPSWIGRFGSADAIVLYEITDNSTLTEVFSLALPWTDNQGSILVSDVVLDSNCGTRWRPAPFFPQNLSIIDVRLSIQWFSSWWNGGGAVVLSGELIQQYARKVGQGWRPPASLEPCSAKVTGPWIPWSEWGPANTRHIDSPPFNYRFDNRAAHGHRRVTFRSETITVLDFTPHLSSWPDPADASLDPRTGSKTEFFDQTDATEFGKVATSLPFHNTVRSYPSRKSDALNGAMIDDEHILLFNLGEECVELVVLTL